MQTQQIESGCPHSADAYPAEGKLAELERKITSLQHLIAELLAMNQQLREQVRMKD